MKNKSTRNPLSSADRQEAVTLLNQNIAELFDLFTRVKQAHWNLQGISFISLHKIFDEFAETILNDLDETAERAGALGGFVEGTLQDAAKSSRLKKKNEPTLDSVQRDWLEELADLHATCAAHTRKAIKKLTKMEDFGTADLLTQSLRHLEKQLWILESHLNK
ncbi:MAG: DNA starvation/stationary phase protection protein Dps [Verrucomicrobiota bacterium]